MRLWYNGQNPHTALLVLTTFNQARLYNLTGDVSAKFTFTIQQPESSFLEEDETVRYQTTYQELVPKVLRSIFFPMVSSLMCSNFVMFPITERVALVR